MRVLLVGGGHTHALVLRALALDRDPRLDVTLVNPGRYATYSGMVPGVLAGRYRLRDAQIDLAALAARAGAAFVEGRATHVDPVQRTVTLGTHARLPYDIASFDVGSEAAGGVPIEPGAAVIPLKPIDAAVRHIAHALSAVPATAPRRLVIAGAGAGGIEVAFALAARIGPLRAGAISVCDANPQPVSERGMRTARLVGAALHEAGVEFLGGVAVARVDRDAVELADHRRIPAELVIWATGAGETRVFADSGLPVDPRGRLLVTDALHTAAHDDVFAAGDCATLIPYPTLAKAGVYAVRQAPVLVHNLRARARAQPLRGFRPQRRFLALLNTGDGRAVLSYGALAWRGRAAWWLKDWIDRRFVARFAEPR
jgi:selenide,water dikinase